MTSQRRSPTTSWYHCQASWFSGSPTQPSTRREDRSYLAAADEGTAVTSGDGEGARQAGWRDGCAVTAQCTLVDTNIECYTAVIVIPYIIEYCTTVL